MYGFFDFRKNELHFLINNVLLISAKIVIFFQIITFFRPLPSNNYLLSNNESCDVFPNLQYSQTYVGGPPLGPLKSGCLGQVVVL